MRHLYLSYLNSLLFVIFIEVMNSPPAGQVRIGKGVPENLSIPTDPYMPNHKKEKSPIFIHMGVPITKITFK